MEERQAQMSQTELDVNHGYAFSQVARAMLCFDPFS